jgi:hypothetical protein
MMIARKISLGKNFDKKNSAAAFRRGGVATRQKRFAVFSPISVTVGGGVARFFVI